jgi:hypothetical protein
MHARMDLQAGAIECMCMALKQFPKKKESVLSLCGPVWYSTRSAPCMSVHADTRSTYHDGQALAFAIRLHEKNQRLFVKHKGVDFLMAIMNKWEEDHDFYFLMLRTLRVRVR